MLKALSVQRHHRQHPWLPERLCLAALRESCVATREAQHTFHGG